MSSDKTYDDLREHVRKFSELEKDWDGEESDPLKPEQIQAALNYIDYLEQNNFLIPHDAYPLPDGNIVFEWYRRSVCRRFECEDLHKGSLTEYSKSPSYSTLVF